MTVKTEEYAKAMEAINAEGTPPPAEEPAKPEEPKDLTIIVKMAPNGAYKGVEGPLDQEILCLGLLECAKNDVVAFNRQRELEARQKRILAAKDIPAGLKIPGIGRIFGGLGRRR